jgi:hypothetical protein
MRLGTQSHLAARLLILAWTIIWVTTVPLFHAHLPDLSERAISQTGVAHTVFSPDLPGEFFRFSPDNQGPFAHLSNRASNSPELGFVFSSGDPKDREVGPPGLFGTLCRPSDRPCLRKSVIEWSVVHHRPLVSAAPQGPRAPPAVVSL